MRLKQMLYVLEENVDKLSVLVQQIAGTGSPGTYRVSDFQQAVRAAKAIEGTGALTDDALRVFIARDIVQSASPEITVSAEQCQSFSSAVQQLKVRAEALRDALRSLFQERKEFTVDIQLPPSRDLGDLEDTTDDLHKALSQSLVNSYIGGTVTLEGFDRGSLWLEIGLGSAAAHMFLGGMLGLLVEWRESRVRLAQFDTMVKDIQIQSQDKQRMRAAYLHQLDAAYEVSLGNLMRSGGIPETDNEQWARVKYCLETLGRLVDKGMEVHPDLMAPKEQRDRFPSPKNLLEFSQRLLASEALVSQPEAPGER
jgi:hypothetical protein